MAADTPSVLITGAARRIGAFLARTLAAHGYALHLHAHTSDLTGAAAALSREFGVPAQEHRLDLRMTDATRSWARRLAHCDHPPSLLINNASAFPPPHQAEEPSALAAGLQLHVLAASALTDELVPSVNHVVNMLDARLDLLDARNPGYEVSKAALAHHTLLAAKRLAPTARVNAIAPGLVLPPPHADDRHLQDLSLQRSPLRRPARLEDVGASVMFLEQATSITGQIIYVDAGEHLGGGDTPSPSSPAWQTETIPASA